MKTAALLAISNLFMTFAWYGHLKHKHAALWKVVVVSWLIAFFEYCFMVPANRIGHNEGYTGAQLKVIQEAITVGVFCIFAATYLKETLRWNHYLGLALVVAAVFVVNYPGSGTSAATAEQRTQNAAAAGVSPSPGGAGNVLP